MSIARKHSRKRDAILECLRCTTSHPTAEWVYTQLKPPIPDLSLATVYRNLAMFKDEGTIDSVGVYNGLERFDFRTDNGHFGNFGVAERDLHAGVGGVRVLDTHRRQEHHAYRRQSE